MNTRRNQSHSPSMNMPSAQKRINRAPLGIVLTLLLPPIGLMYLWRNGIFRTRGRMLITALATVEMAILAVLFMPQSTITTALPMPGAAARISPAPESDVLTALSNMDQLLREQQSGSADASSSSVNRVSQAETLAAQQDVLNTIVYAVYDSGARYYHSVTVCGNQSNLRSLTVMEAIQEGLGACSSCDPPTYSPKMEVAATLSPEG